MTYAIFLLVTAVCAFGLSDKQNLFRYGYD